MFLEKLQKRKEKKTNKVTDFTAGKTAGNSDGRNLQKKWQIKPDGEKKAVILKHAIESADAAVIGAGSGLSTSAGFTYTGDRFRKYFVDFAEKYGFEDMYSGGFYPFDSLEEYWAYWSRYIYINRYMNAPKPVYEQLLKLVKNKDYFVLTTNVDHCFQKAGFDKKRLFYTQGDYGLWQCSGPCHRETYDNESQVEEMMKAQGFLFGESGEKEKLALPKGQKAGMRIPTELIPRCPRCGRPMSMNLRADNTFVEDEGWHRAAERYSGFLRRHRNLKTVYLELGTGMNTPSIIKFNFWRMTGEQPEAVYGCINLGEAWAPDEIKDKSICINADIGQTLQEMSETGVRK